MQTELNQKAWKMCVALGKDQPELGASLEAGYDPTEQKHC